MKVKSLLILGRVGGNNWRYSFLCSATAEVFVVFVDWTRRLILSAWSVLVTNSDLVGSCVDYFPITSIWDISNFKNEITSCCRLFYKDKTSFFGYFFAFCRFVIDFLTNWDKPFLYVLQVLDILNLQHILTLQQAGLESYLQV